jgi:hypothetical protein
VALAASRIISCGSGAYQRWQLVALAAALGGHQPRSAYLAASSSWWRRGIIRGCQL